MMKIEEKRVGEVVILVLKGKIVLLDGSDVVFEERLKALSRAGARCILIDLWGVPYIDAAGLGALVRSYTAVSRAGGRLKLLNLTQRITDLLVITRLLSIFEVFENENEAVTSFTAVESSGNRG